MLNKNLPGNLERLRSDRGLSQKALAGQAGLSLSGYRKIKQGESMPQARTLLALADALDVRVHDLTEPARVLTAVRFRSTKKLKSREQVLIDVADRLSDFNALELILSETKPWHLGNPGVRGEGIAKAKLAAQLLRGQFGLRDDEPVHDLTGLLEANGVKVIPIERQAEGFFGLSVAPSDGGPAVVVNTWERISAERRIFTAAHELGHLVLHLGEYNIEVTEESDADEEEANAFASTFLMPAVLFDKEWQQTRGLRFVDRVLKVKTIFRVSYKTVLVRVQEQRLGGNNPFMRFSVEHNAVYGGNLKGHREPQKLPKIDFEEDRLAALVRMAIERSEISVSRGAEILHISVEEMRDRSALWELDSPTPMGV